MSTTQDLKLEIVVIPVSDVDRAKAFYEGLGWRLDADLAAAGLPDRPVHSPRLRLLDPVRRRPHLGCPRLGAEPPTWSPTSRRRTPSSSPTVSTAARCSTTPPAATTASTPTVRAVAPIRERRTYASFAEFTDPDGNLWQLQEITSRLPGRVDSATTDFSSVGGSGERDATCVGCPRPARGPDRPGGRELARLVRRVHGGGAIRGRAPDADRRPEVTMSRRAGARRADRRRDRRQRRHRARDRAARACARAPTSSSPRATRTACRRSASELGARVSRPSTPPTSIGCGAFFDELPTPIDHVLVTGPGPVLRAAAPIRASTKARRDVEAHLLLPIEVARHAMGTVRPGGTLLFMGGTGGRRTAPGLALISALTAAMPP